MNFRWLWFNHVPSGVQLTKKERLILWASLQEVRNDAPWHARVLFLLASFVFPIGVGVAAQFYLATQVLPKMGASNFLALLSGATPMVIAWILITYITYFFKRKHVYSALNDLGHRVCLECGYCLHGLADDARRCPECGSLVTVPRRFSPDELCDAQLVRCMHDLGHVVCLRCGLVRKDYKGLEPTPCPECRTPAANKP